MGRLYVSIVIYINFNGFYIYVCGIILDVLSVVGYILIDGGSFIWVKSM